MRLQDQAVMTVPSVLSSKVRPFQRKELADLFHLRSDCFFFLHRSQISKNFYISGKKSILILHTSCHVLTGRLPELPVTQREASQLQTCTTCRGLSQTSVTSVLECPGCSSCLWGCSGRVQSMWLQPLITTMYECWSGFYCLWLQFPKLISWGFFFSVWQVIYSSCGAQTFSSVGTSAFLSKTGRSSFYRDDSLPSPCRF